MNKQAKYRLGTEVCVSPSDETTVSKGFVVGVRRTNTAGYAYAVYFPSSTEHSVIHRHMDMAWADGHPMNLPAYRFYFENQLKSTKERTQMKIMDFRFKDTVKTRGPIGSGVVMEGQIVGIKILNSGSIRYIVYAPEATISLRNPCCSNGRLEPFFQNVRWSSVDHPREECNYVARCAADLTLVSIAEPIPTPLVKKEQQSSIFELGSEVLATHPMGGDEKVKGFITGLRRLNTTAAYGYIIYFPEHHSMKSLVNYSTVQGTGNVITWEVGHPINQSAYRLYLEESLTLVSSETEAVASETVEEKVDFKWRKEFEAWVRGEIVLYRTQARTTKRWSSWQRLSKSGGYWGVTDDREYKITPKYENGAWYNLEIVGTVAGETKNIVARAREVGTQDCYRLFETVDDEGFTVTYTEEDSNIRRIRKIV